MHTRVPQWSGGMTLEVNRHEITLFVDTLFKHAAAQSFVSLRSFYDGGGDKPFRINPVRLTGDLAFLTKTAGEEAFRAANNPKKIVFCPPIATFKTKDHAAEGDIHQRLALSVECDEHPRAAREKLEELRRGPSQRCCCGPSPPFPAAYIRRLR
jgi:hypothetical protein